jgi:hypothetical protein
VAVWIADHGHVLTQLYEDLRSVGLLRRVSRGDFAEIMCLCSMVPGGHSGLRRCVPPLYEAFDGGSDSDTDVFSDSDN